MAPKSKKRHAAAKQTAVKQRKVAIGPSDPEPGILEGTTQLVEDRYVNIASISAEILGLVHSFVLDQSMNRYSGCCRATQRRASEAGVVSLEIDSWKALASVGHKCYQVRLLSMKDRFSTAFLKSTLLRQSVVVLHLQSQRSMRIPELWSASAFARVRELRLESNFKQCLAPLPPDLRKLSFAPAPRFNDELGILPNGLEELQLGIRFNKPLGRLPANLRILSFASSDDLRVNGSVSAAKSNMGQFSQPLGDLPRKLTELLLSDAFHLPLGNLPESLRKLRLGLQGELTGDPLGLPGLVSLICRSCKYDGVGDEVVPRSCLEELDIRGSSIRQLRVPLCATLKRLYLPMGFNQHLGKLPHSLEEIDLEDGLFTPPLPPNLRIFKTSNGVNQPLGRLPQKIEQLCPGAAFNQPLGVLPQSLVIFGDLHRGSYLHEFNQDLGRLPENLEILHLGGHFNRPLGELPLSLKKITIGSHLPDDHFNQPLGNLRHLQNLKVLMLGNRFNKPLGQLPDCIEALGICGSFNQRIRNLPVKLKVLILGNKFSHPLSRLPCEHLYLSLGNAFNHPLGQLPRTLNTLDLGRQFAYSLGRLPPNLGVKRFDLQKYVRSL